MNSKNIKERINYLVNLINKWNREYYVESSPSVSDLEYDKKLLELEKLEQQYPQFIFPNSPTKHVNNELDNKFKKIEHKNPMLSLSKAYNYEEILKYIENIKKIVPLEEINFSLEPKIDGLSISLHYKNGILIQALTRGNGMEGEDVTQNVYQIASIPKIIDYSNDLEVRGEVFLSKSRFIELNKELKSQNKPLFSNPRNAASGTLRQLDQDIVKERKLDCFLYELVSPETHNIFLQNEAINFMKKLNIPTNNFFKVVEIEELEEEIADFAEKKNKFDFDVDGLVIKLNNLHYWSNLGRTAKFPKHSIAFKYDVENAITTVKKILTTVGRTGKITYVAKTDKVELNQTNVTAATLHNFNFIKSINLNVGDDVKIVKAGEIIPKVVELVRKNSKDVFSKPLKCPSCSHDLIEYPGNVDQFCVNKKCEEIIINTISHFTSRKAMDIVGLGLRTIEIFFKNKIIQKIEDIFTIEKFKNQIISLEKFGLKKYENIVNSIEKAKSVKFSKVLFALGIKHLGERVAKLLSVHYSSFQEIIDDKNLSKINDSLNIGPKIIESLTEYVSDDNNKNLMIFLDSILDYEQPLKTTTKLSNLTFVLTGKIGLYSRDHYVEIIEKNGGRVATSISSKVNYLIVGENAGSKLNKAQKLNIKIINEREFLELLK
ncbi:NAD-dependent DNA ligase LigA [Mycoplasmopsis lipofaciens]|uniref:NAD-dependent DNA ligase LigA n=1 Tax=Mycoplasmopsis lipofaciens TaxID=114884 RepID=UPI000489B1E5|nr:NAD-dependent DNA ligase LigA [Mycoplasmopsis lipofaciens]